MTSGGHDVVLVRHGRTSWSEAGRHTGRTDVPLDDVGRAQAARLGARLAGQQFALVLTSPLSRATDTCKLAGFGDDAVVDDDLLEWDYGEMEGLRTADVRERRPGWTVWRDGVEGGETVDQVGARADRVIARVRAADGDVALFGHAHQLRILAARWLGLGAVGGALFVLEPASVSILGYERETAVIRLFNDRSHLEDVS